jgi:hypothetical protein
MLFFLEIARYACLVGFNAIECELASFWCGSHARLNNEMQAGKSLHAFNLLYTCKAEKLLPGRNAFNCNLLAFKRAHLFPNKHAFIVSIVPGKR